MKIKLKNIEQYIEYDRKCYLLTYELNDSRMILDYCVGHYFRMEHLVQQSKELIDKAKELAEKKEFETIQLYLPQNISTDEVSFYKENGFEFYPKCSVKMYYKKIMNGKSNGFPPARRRTTPPPIIILKDENYLKDENGNKIINNKNK